jgi:hypothetical protein
MAPVLGIPSSLSLSMVPYSVQCNNNKNNNNNIMSVGAEERNNISSGSCDSGESDAVPAQLYIHRIIIIIIIVYDVCVYIYIYIYIILCRYKRTSNALNED